MEFQCRCRHRSHGSVRQHTNDRACVSIFKDNVPAARIGRRDLPTMGPSGGQAHYLLQCSRALSKLAALVTIVAGGKLHRSTHVTCLTLILAFAAAAAPVDGPTRAVSTFESIGLYYDRDSSPAGCHVRYRIADTAGLA